MNVKSLLHAKGWTELANNKRIMEFFSNSKTGTTYNVMPENKQEPQILTLKESILQEWLLKLKLCTDFTLKHRWRPKIKKLFLH